MSKTAVVAERVVYPSSLQRYAKQYRSMNEEERSAEMDRLCGWSVEIVSRSAVLLSEMVANKDERADDIFRRYGRYAQRLMYVAKGRLAPEALFRFRDKHKLLTKLLSVSEERQKEIIAKDSIEVAVVNPSNGEFVLRPILLADLTDTQIDQAIGVDGDESFGKQVAFAEGRPALAMRPAKYPHVKVDKHRHLVYIKGEPFTPAQLRQFADDAERIR